MFVRRKKGKGKSYYYLCESQRVAGQSVHTTLGALGHCPDNASKIEKQLFWQQVDSKLQQLSIPDAEQEKIKEKIAEKVSYDVADSVPKSQESNKVQLPQRELLGNQIAAEIQPTPIADSKNETETITSRDSLGSDLVATENDSFLQALKNLNNHGGRFDSVLVQGILEGFMDGILILTQQDEFIHINNNARRILEKFSRNQTQTQDISRAIKRIYQAVLGSRELYEKPVVIESEIGDKRLSTLRIRARWLQLEAYEQPLVLILLEDQHCSIQSLAVTEAEKYGLTSREAEIWLLRRANRSYKEIAAELFISLNTVKKHVKSIRDKLAFYKFRQDSSAVEPDSSVE